MKLTFQRWLFNQKQRRDQIGNLARAMAKIDFSYVQFGPNSDEHKEWANIITRHGEPEHILAFNQAWDAYQTIKQEMTLQT